jgi:hypothetical protein
MSANGGGGTGTYTYLWYKDGVSTGVTTQTYDPDGNGASLTMSFRISTVQNQHTGLLKIMPGKLT